MNAFLWITDVRTIDGTDVDFNAYDVSFVMADKNKPGHASVQKYDLISFKNGRSIEAEPGTIKKLRRAMRERG